MEFDWSAYSPKGITQNEAAESFEDPFSIRIFPDSGRIAAQSRFFCLGKSLKGRGVFSVYASNGKLIRLITSRVMTDEEEFFYNRKLKEDL